MKNIFLILLLSILSITAFSQATPNRASCAVIAYDCNVGGTNSLRIPVFNDTTGMASLGDSLGCLMYRKIDSSVYVRLPAGGTTKKWVRLLKSGQAINSVSWGQIIGTLSNQTDLLNALNLKADQQGLVDTAAALRSFIETFLVNAFNGLTKDGQNIKLGGSLIEDTQIPLNDHQLIIGASTNGSVILQAGVGALDNKASSILDMDSTSISLQWSDNLGSPITKNIVLGRNEAGIIINDDGELLGMKYGSDYSANGLLNPRWIPDIAAVRSTINDSSGNYITNDTTITQSGGANIDGIFYSRILKAGNARNGFWDARATSLSPAFITVTDSTDPRIARINSYLFQTTAYKDSIYIPGSGPTCLAVTNAVGANNTQDWPALSGSPSINGMQAAIDGEVGASGTIGKAIAILGKIGQNIGVTLTEANAFEAMNSKTAGMLTYYNGLRVNDLDRGSNSTALYMVDRRDKLPPFGKYGIYDSVGYLNYLKNLRVDSIIAKNGYYGDSLFSTFNTQQAKQFSKLTTVMDSINPVALSHFGLLSAMRFANTTAPPANQNFFGSYNTVGIESENTQGLSSLGGHPSIVGSASIIGAVNGASGNFEKAAPFYATFANSAPSATFEEVNLIDITYDHSNSNTVNHANGIRIADLDMGNHSTGIYFVIGDSKASPDDRYLMYDSIGYKSYLKSIWTDTVRFRSLPQNGTSADSALTIGNDGIIKRVSPSVISGTSTFQTVTNNNGNTTTNKISVGAASTPLGIINIYQPTAGIGTVSVTASGTTVTGTNTLFLYDFNIGDSITANAETQRITAIASNTSMTTTAWTNNFSGAYTLTGGLRQGALGKGGLLFGTSTPTSADSRYLHGVTTINNGATVVGITSSPTVSNTVSAGTTILGINTTATIGASNTQNWVQILGMAPTISITSGATGTIANAVNVTAGMSNSASGATITNGVGIRTGINSNSGTITNYRSIFGYGLNLSSNNTGVFLTTGNSTTSGPSGNYGIYDATGYASYYAGSIGINTTSPGAFGLNVNRSVAINKDSVTSITSYGSNMPLVIDTATGKLQKIASFDAGIPVVGSFSQVGAATTTFTVTIGSTLPNATYKVNVTPTASLSAALFYVTNKTTTTFDVVYLAGLTGTVTFDWSVFK